MFVTFFLSSILLLPVPDIIRLEGGTSVEGRIVRESPEQVVILTATGGEVVIPRSRIREIVREPWSVDQFEELWSKVDKGDLAAMERLMEWCLHPDRAASLRAQAKQVARYITAKLDKNHAKAWGVLDCVQVEGRWIPRAQAQRQAREQAAAQAEAERLAKEEAARQAERRQALELIGGVELAEQVAANREGDLEEEREIRDKLGLEYTIRSSRRISVKGVLDQEQALHFLELGERMCGTLNRELGLPAASSPFSTGKKERIHFFLIERPQLAAVLGYINGRYTRYPPEFLKFSIERQGGVTADGDGCVGVQISGDEHNEDVFCHYFGHAYVESLGRNVGHWFTEGFAVYCALRFHGNAVHLCTTQSRYAQNAAEQSRKDLAIPLAFKELQKKGLLPPTRGLLNKHMNRLDEKDLAKSWGAVTFFMTEPRRAKFLDYLRRMPMAGGKHEPVLQAVYGLGMEQFDDEVARQQMKE